MLTKALHKLLAKITTLGIVVGMLMPLGGLVGADVQTGTLRVGMNTTTGGFEVYSIQDIDDDQIPDYVLEMDSSTCTLEFDTNGYYCTSYSQPTGAYLVLYEPVAGYDLNVYKNGVPSGTFMHEGKIAVAVQLTTIGMDVLGEYYIPGLAQLRVGMNITSGAFQVYSVQDIDGDEIPDYVLEMDSSTCTLEFDTNGYYCTSYSQPTGAYLIAYTSVTGYEIEVTEEGIPQGTFLYDTDKIAVDIQLESSGTSVLGSYSPLGVQTGTLRVGMNTTEGDFEVYSIQDIDGDEIPDYVLEMDSSTCTLEFDTDGYYCTSYSQPTGAYLVLYTPVIGYELNVYEDGLPTGTFMYLGNVAADIQLTTAGSRVLGEYYIPGTGELSVGVNLQSGGFEIYPDGETTPVVTVTDAGTECVYDVSGYYICSYDLPTGIYDIIFLEVDGYFEPGPRDDIELTVSGELILGDYSVVYDGTVEVEVVNQYGYTIPIPEGSWVIMLCGNADPESCTGLPVMDGGVGYIQSGLQYGTYRVVFPSDDLPAGYIGRQVLPTIYQVLNEEDDYIIFTIQYISEEAVDESYIEVNVNGPAGLVSAEISIEEDSTTTTVVDHEPINNGNPETFVVQPGEAHTVICHDVSGFVTDTPTINISALEESETASVTCQYSDLSVDDSYIEVTVDGPAGLVSAEVSIEEDSTTTTVVDHEPIDNGTFEIFTVQPSETHTVTCHDVVGFVTDTPTINVSALAGGETAPVTCQYSEIITGEAYIEVAVDGPAGLASAEVSIEVDSTTTTVVDHEPIDNGTSETFTVQPSETHTITCHDVAGFVTDTPTINVPVLAEGETSSVTCQYSEIPSGDEVDFIVSAEDEDSNVLNVTFTHDLGSDTTPNNVEVDPSELDDFTISFEDIPGFIAPEDVVIINGIVQGTPEGITITLNGLPYVAGTEIQANDTVEILGTYEDLMRLTKVATEQVIVNNNKRVDYTITVERNDRDTTVGDITMTLHDTISDGGGTLYGNIGGTMTYVLGTVTCSNFCGDVVAGDVDVTISNPGNSVILTYQLLSNNSTIPANQSSIFINTVTGNYDDEADPVQVTNQAQVIVSAPPTSTPIPPPSGGGGGGGGGGGHIMVNGDMVLEVEKLVSLDNQHWVDASSTSSALALPETTSSTKVYVKVKVKNLGKVSATDIVFAQFFDPADSNMSAGQISNVKGAIFRDAENEIEIQKIIVNGTVEFSYELLVNKSGPTTSLAKDVLELVDFDSALSASQDYLTYHGIGDEYPSYLGTGDVIVYGDERLKITVTSDKTEANIGDIVNLLITAENMTDGDITGLVLTHDYDESALEVLNPFGGRDNGLDVQWTRAILRPGEETSFQVQIRVGNNAPVGESVRGLTLALVNEFEGIAPVENFLYILGGVAPTDPDWQLAQTGPAQFFLFLIALALAYLGYKESWRIRYAYTKRQALRPL